MCSPPLPGNLYSARGNRKKRVPHASGVARAWRGRGAGMARAWRGLVLQHGPRMLCTRMWNKPTPPGVSIPVVCRDALFSQLFHYTPDADQPSAGGGGGAPIRVYAWLPGSAKVYPAPPCGAPAIAVEEEREGCVRRLTCTSQ
eukprot:gene22802-biopygen2779